MRPLHEDSIRASRRALYVTGTRVAVPTADPFFGTLGAPQRQTSRMRQV